MCFFPTDVFNSPERRSSNNRSATNGHSNVGKSSLFIHIGHLALIIVSSPAEVSVFGRILKDERLCLDVMRSGAEWHTRLSRSGSNLIHGDALSVLPFSFEWLQIK